MRMIRAGRHKRPARPSLMAAAAAMLAAVPLPALAQAPPAALEDAVRAIAGDNPGIADFYRARGYRPLWIEQSRPTPATFELLRLVNGAWWDGLDPAMLGASQLDRALAGARDGSARALAIAELAASHSLVAHVAALRRPSKAHIIYADPELAPAPPPARAALEAAAAAPSLTAFVKDIGWMHPLYGKLREAGIAEDGARRGRELQAELVRINLDRARMLPVDRGQRYILVDAAAATLTMYQERQPIGSMRVVVGRPSDPTPMMAGLIRYAVINPYWNVPPDLVADRIASHVVNDGMSHLTAKRYQVLSDWSDQAKVVDPAEIDWSAVAAGQRELRVRQLPGPANAMGKMKFMFPNALGVYLHDTPDTELFSEAARLFSAGCVRLEQAPLLARWLYGKPLLSRSNEPEYKVPLPEPVPVYLTYLTAYPQDGRIAYRTDVYKRDSAQLAALAGS